jgi:hypothetical protein
MCISYLGIEIRGSPWHTYNNSIGSEDLLGTFHPILFDFLEPGDRLTMLLILLSYF